jgi:hypothetical protein
LPLVALVLLASACQVRTQVRVTAEEDGSGTVDVAVGLDAEALERVPDLDDDGTSGVADLAALVRTEDLEAAGWHVAEPTEAGSELTWIRVSKEFDTPEEANAILAELTGREGPLRNLTLERSTGFASTSLSFSGTADLSGGLESFGDAALAQALDGEALGEDAAQIEQRLGQQLAEAFRLDVIVDLPAGTTRWTPRLGAEPEALEATASVRDWPVLIFTALAVLLVLAAIVTAARLVLPTLGSGADPGRAPSPASPDDPDGPPAPGSGAGQAREAGLADAPSGAYGPARAGAGATPGAAHSRGAVEPAAGRSGAHGPAVAGSGVDAWTTPPTPAASQPAPDRDAGSGLAESDRQGAPTDAGGGLPAWYTDSRGAPDGTDTPDIPGGWRHPPPVPPASGASSPPPAPSPDASADVGGRRHPPPVSAGPEPSRSPDAVADVGGWRHPPPVSAGPEPSRSPDAVADVGGWRHPPPVPAGPEPSASPGTLSDVGGWRHPPPVPGESDGSDDDGSDEKGDGSPGDGAGGRSATGEGQGPGVPRRW